MPQALSGWRPSISVQGNASITTDNLLTVGNRNRTYESGGVNLQINQPLFRGFRTIESTKFAEARESQARNVAALARFRDLAALRYREGATIYLEVSSAEQNLFSAQLAYVAVQAQLFQSYANLYKAVGGGWDTDAEKLAGAKL